MSKHKSLIQALDDAIDRLDRSAEAVGGDTFLYKRWRRSEKKLRQLRELLKKAPTPRPQ